VTRMNNQTIYKSEAGRTEVRAAYDALLAKWPVPSTPFTVATRLGDTFVLQCGNYGRSPVLLLHGSSSNSAMWAAYAGEWSKTHCVYCIDIPGEPGKSAEKQYPLNGDSYVKWLDEVVCGLGLATVALVGISLGGWMSAAYSIRHSQRVSKLVLLSPSGIGKQKASFMLKAIPLLLLGEKGKEKIARSLYGNKSISKESIQYITFISKHFKPRTGKIPVFSDEQLRQLTMPLLCIAGERDVMLNSAQTAERVHALLPNADMRVVPGAGHVLVNVTNDVSLFLNDAAPCKK